MDGHPEVLEKLVEQRVKAFDNAFLKIGTDLRLSERLDLSKKRRLLTLSAYLDTVKVAERYRMEHRQLQQEEGAIERQLKADFQATLPPGFNNVTSPYHVVQQVNAAQARFDQKAASIKAAYEKKVSAFFSKYAFSPQAMHLSVVK
jgi:hypothetical protein